MTCGVAFLLEFTAVRLVLAFRSSEVMKEFRAGCRYARRDPDIVLRLAGRAGATGSAGHIEDSPWPGTMTFVPSTIPFRQKGASMSTDVADRIESSIDIKQGKSASR